MIIPFPGARRIAPPYDPRAVLVVGVDDDLASEVSPVPLRMEGGPLVRYITRHDLELQSAEPDLW
ncbi:MAG TPA: hypothetical protein VFN74_11050, partial [Chloroflexota bacterium]|nr:hypothetical protein [Chloroflexota bacterium]